MFRAVEKAKIRKESIEVLTHDASWRNVIKRNEDFLTASVFSRILYLPTEILWSLLCKSLSSTGELPATCGDLLSVDFWPYWDISEIDSIEGQHREPDVFIRFKNVNLIIEAKIDDKPGRQSVSQWVEQTVAMYNQPDISDDRNKPIFILVIGGCGVSPTIQNMNSEIIKYRQQVSALISEQVCELAFCSWQRFSYETNRLLSFLRKQKNVEDNYAFTSTNFNHLINIVTDLNSILKFYGFKLWRFFDKTIIKTDFTSIKNESLICFAEMSGGKHSGPERQLKNWWEISDFRQIKIHSFNF